MTTYIIRRLLLMIPTFFGASVLIFALVRFMPGDIVSIIASETPGSHANVEALRHRFGLDEPPATQYVKWVGKIVRGDLGTSLRTGKDIRSDLAKNVPVSIELGLLAMLIGLVVAVPVGVLAALRRNSVLDYVVRSLAVLALATPSFWIGILVITWPSVWWGWSPPVQYVRFTDDPLANLAQMWLPALIVGLHLTGSVMRFTRTAMLEVLTQDYVRTAWAKGLAPRIIVIRHVLRNSLVPVVTIIGLQIPLLIGGVVIAETIFGVPGMGRYMLSALQNRDYQVVQAVVALMVVIVLFVNLAVDLLYAVLDPRIRYS
jgi:peptide/nickel transport system permease protein